MQQPTNKVTVFNFNLQIPMEEPTPEEHIVLSERLEPFVEHLIGTGYLSKEEAVAFLKFSHLFSGLNLFFMDVFLKAYRDSKSEEARSKLVLPSDLSKDLIIPN